MAKTIIIPSIDNHATRWGLPQHIIKDNSFIFSFIFTGIALLIILSTLPVIYEFNDDFTMVTILSGNGGFPSTPDAIFLNPVLSYVLYLLYKISPFFPWYGIFLYTIHYLGWTLILSVIVRSNKGICFLFAVPLFSCFFFYHSSAISFTSASLFLAFGVFLCIVEYFIRNETPIKNIKIYFIFLASCFYLSFLFRWDLVLYSLLLFLPMLVFMKYSQIKKVLPILIILGLVICINTGFNYLVSINRQSYNEFNNLRGEFYDTASGDIHNRITEYALNKVGWTYEDYLDFKSLYLIYDNYTFNTQNLRKFITENDPRQDKKYYVNYIINKINDSYEHNKLLSILLIISTFSVVILRLTNLMRLYKVDWIRITISLGSIIISVLFLMYYRFVQRIYGPLFIYLFSMSFLLFNNLRDSGHKIININYIKLFTIITTGAFMAYALLIVHQSITGYIQLLELAERYKVLINQTFNIIENQNHISNPIVIQMCPAMGSGLGSEFINPLKEYKDSPPIRVFPSGWLINSPYYDMVLKKLKLRDGHEFLNWLIDRKDVLLLLYVRSTEQMKFIIYLWKSYYLRHIIPGRNLDLIPVYDFRNQNESGLILFQIRSENH